MSLNYFCPSCGKKTPYQFTKPIFCSSCGLRFSDGLGLSGSETSATISVKATPTKTTVAAAPKRANFIQFEESRSNNRSRDNRIADSELDDEDDYDDDFREQFANMSGLDVVIQSSSPDRGESLRDIAHQKPDDAPVNRSMQSRQRGRPRKKLAVTASNLPKDFVEHSSQRGRGQQVQDIDFGMGEND